MAGREHWEQVYASRADTEVSWFEAQARTSLELIGQALGELGGPDRARERPVRLIDVGAGASRLVDALRDRPGFDLTVLDLSSTALGVSRDRLGDRATAVTWMVGDITAAELRGPFDIWHDRAAFHFLVDPADRRRYVAQLSAAVTGGGFVVLATFAEDGPERCSSLPVQRYGPETLAAELGPAFEPVTALRHAHLTPSGREQRFQYSLLRRREQV